LNVGIVGAGRIGSLHAEHLARHVPGVRIGAIADVNIAAAKELAGRHAVESAVDDYRQLTENPGIDAVIVCSSTDTHVDVIRAAADAGKHVFCEKPLDTDLRRIEDMLRHVESTGVTLQVGFNRRFDPNFRRMRQAIEEGAIGTPHVLKITSRDPAPPPEEYIRTSGGLFMDMTIHDFDMARFMMGDEVVEVFATGASLVDPSIGRLGDIDTAVVTLTFAGGGLGVIDNSRKAAYGYDQRVEVLGSAGMVATDNRTEDNHYVFDSTGRHSAKPLYFFLERYTESFITEMKEFVAAVLNGLRPPVDGHDGYVPVVIAHAAKKSLVERRPVRLEEIASLVIWDAARLPAR
jgi:myo-inositol 2-dehydrogenase / D-chiro-inositol 1-dehydrogenase